MHRERPGFWECALATVDELILARRGRWEQLAALLQRAGSDPRRLHATEIEQLS